MSVNPNTGELNRQADLPPSYRAKAFRAVETVLKQDPVLNRVVKTWRSRRGFDDDATPPSYDEMPLVALSPSPQANTLEAPLGLVQINLVIQVEVFVPGTCFEDIDAIWGAIEDAVVKTKPFRPGTPGEETVQDFLCRCISGAPTGIRSLWAQSPAFAELKLAAQDNERTSQRGVGSLSGYILRPA